MANSLRVPPEGWTMKDETPWPGNNTKDHPGMIQILLARSGGNEGDELPCLVYMSREKRPAFQHHSKAGAVNALVNIPRTISDLSHYAFSLPHRHKAKISFLLWPNVPGFSASRISGAKQFSFRAELGLQSLCE